MYMYMHMQRYTYVYVIVCVCICAHVRVHVYVYVYVLCMYVCLFGHVYVCMYGCTTQHYIFDIDFCADLVDYEFCSLVNSLFGWLVG